VKETTVSADGTAAAKNKLQIIDDTDWEPIVPVWLEHFRIATSERYGAYSAFTKFLRRAAARH
jgi:hypothetical protein